MFKIKGWDFDIQQAFLDAYLDEDNSTVDWGLTIIGCSSDSGHERWKPKITSEKLVSTKPREVLDWKGLAGRSIQWSDEYDEDGDEYALLYLFEHSPIYQSKIFLAIAEKGLHVKWTGKSDINLDSKDENKIDINISLVIPFKGIWMGRTSEEECMEIISKYFDPSLFLYTQTEQGVALLKLKN